MQLTPQDICQMCADSLFYKPYVRNVNVRFNISYVSFPELISFVTSTLFDLGKYHRESYRSRKLAKAAIALWPWRQLQKGLHPLREERVSTRKKQTVKAAAALGTVS